MKHQEYINKMLWFKVDYDWYYWNQCVDMVRDYCNRIFWLNFKPVGNAKELWYQNWWQDFKKIPNKITTLPKQWDIVIWGNGKYWHIAIIDKAELFSFVCVEQNAWNGNWDGWWNNAIRLKRYYYRNVLWFIRYTALVNDFNLYNDIEYPKQYKWIPVRLSSSSWVKITKGVKRTTYWLASIKWIHPKFKKDEIIIYPTTFEKYNTPELLIKLLDHEINHFVVHKYLSDIEKEVIKGLFQISNDKVFPSKYSKTHPFEFIAEIVSWGYYKQNNPLPKNKKWTEETEFVFSIFDKLHKKGLKELKV